MVRGIPIILILGILPLRGATIVATDSIRHAITCARDGDTILVCGPRVFSESLTIDKSISLVGTNAPVIDGGRNGTVLLIDAPNVSVNGLVIRNSGVDLAGFDSGIRIEKDHAAVSHCRIENDAFGIYVRGANHAVLRDNQVAGADDGASAARGNGIHLWKTRGNQLLRNTIRVKRDGIYLSYADENVIRGNVVERSRFGIHYMYSHHNRLLENTLSGNSVGATLMFARHCVVEGNRVVANLRHGILLKQFESSRVVGNFISGHNRGLFVQQAVQDRFENNHIARNDIGLYLSGGSEQNVFVGNRFDDNTDQVWQSADGFDLGALGGNSFFENGRGNFWSDYTGADRDHNGICDTPYHETDLFGYIVNRHPEARVFALSPAAALLRKGEEILPLVSVAGVTDLFPLMHPAPGRREDAPITRRNGGE